MDDLERIRQHKLEELRRKLEKQAEPTSSTPIILTDRDFDQIVSHHPRLVVDCWAEWCAPCRRLAPVIDQLASEYAGKITFAKLNVDENPRITRRYNIQSIPMLLFLKNGAIVNQIVGAVPKQYIEQQLHHLK